jgi:pimeloyl-ACP methyl ester carboxylesterase
VLLHAFPLNASMWASQFEAMSERGWHVVAPHVRGFGITSHAEHAEHAEKSNGGEGRSSAGSAGSAWNATVDDYAGDVVDLLDGLHIHEAVVGGLSMGGYVAFALLRLAPRYVQGLVLADTRPQADTAEARESRDRNAELARREGVGVLVDAMLPKLLGETTRRERPDVGARVQELARANPVEAIVAALGAMKHRPDSTPLLSAIHVPTLVIAGEEDSIAPPAVAEEMQQAIAGAELAIIPAAGHLSSLERPDAFNDALARFLDHRV